MSKNNARMLIAITGFCLCLCASTIVQASNNVPLDPTLRKFHRTGKTGPVPGRFVVKLAERASWQQVRLSLSANEDLRRVTDLTPRAELKGADQWSRYYVVTSSDATLTETDLRARIGEPNIEFIEQDHYVELYEYPSDALVDHQWYLNNTGQGYYGVERRPGLGNDTLVVQTGTPGADINITSFYDSPPPGTTKVVVAVIDTGVDMFHPELAGRIWKNPDEIPQNGIDDDHNGFVDDTVGYDISGDIDDLFNMQPDNDPSDYHGHGTHIAGTIAATTDALGIAGIAPWAEIMPVKFLPMATNSTGAACIAYAVNSGAQVCNISWGGPFESLILKEAMDFARANGVFIAVAAGNSGDTSVTYPPCFDSSFAVGASNSDGYMTYFSTYGRMIDVVAPGRDILSLRATGTDMYGEDGEPGVHIIHGEDNDSLYYLSDGTSMAAPMVAGAAAFLLSIRPDLNLAQLEEALREGAEDMIDPLQLGDVLVGPDSISGYGLLDLQGAYDYLTFGGAYIAWPLSRTRHTSDVQIKIAASGLYYGGYELSYALNGDTTDWISLGSGGTLPVDSVAYTFGAGDPDGHIYLRLVDDFDNQSILSFTFVQNDMFEVTSPTAGQDVKYHVPIHGSVYGTTYDSLSIYYRNGGPDEHIATVTTETFDSEIHSWNISGVNPGVYELVLYRYSGIDVADTSISINVLSSYTAGWPQALSDRGAYSAVCADLNKDGVREIIVGTVSGLSAFTADGTPLEGFPVLPEKDCRTIPAIYDVDRDGEDEIIFTDDSALHVVNYDGTYANGWPRKCQSGILGSGMPHPTVTKLGAAEDSAIILVSPWGMLQAFEFNGDSYFYSLEGYYGQFGQMQYKSQWYSGNAVSSADLTGDNDHEVVVSFSGFPPFTGMGLFDSRSGQPASDLPSPQIIEAPLILGTVLTDLTGDGLMEVVVNGQDDDGVSTLWVRTQADQPLTGWPRRLPETTYWLGSYPTAADLDLDGVPEILVCYYGFDISSFYIFNADGTPYIQRAGRPEGEVYHASVSLGMPMVANLTGDEYPEIIIRGGYLLPGTGPERVYLFDHLGEPVPGWPIETATRSSTVFSTPFVPLVDDIDSDGQVELVLIGEANDIYIWDFPASYDEGRNKTRLFNDNCNSSIYVPPVSGGGMAGEAVTK